MKYCPYCKCELTEIRVDTETRMACNDSACGFVFWDNPVPVVAALVLYRDKLVLARNAAWPNKVFSLITGYLEKNETPEQAVLRETKEELGLEGEIGSFIGYYSFFAKNQIHLAFSVKASGELSTNQEIADVKFVSLQQVPGYSFGRLVLAETIVKDWLKKN